VEREIDLKLTFRELCAGFRKLEIDPALPVVVHASLSSFGQVNGGAQAVVEALLACYNTVVMPTFTYKTMLVPEIGPPNNAILYGRGTSVNFMADFFTPEMPADRLIGAIPEVLRCHPQARRTFHPILSFAGVNATQILQCQTLEEPLAPLAALHEAGGWVLLLGVNHTVNTSIHCGEMQAGRRQFVRWALTPQGVLQCPGFPGCSDGFEAIAPHLEGITRRVRIGKSGVQAIPLADLLATVCRLVSADPLALLCNRFYCERCQAVREDVQAIWQSSGSFPPALQ